MNPIKKSFQFGDHQVVITTGDIARQATGAVLVDIDDTVVMVSVVAQSADEKRDFFPLTVDYQEKSYAAGRIPGNFFRREGRPSEKETLTSRLIDRPIRPLFPQGFTDEVQVIATVISLNPEIDPDIPALLGTSAALAISGLPFNGPIGAARVGYKDGQYVLNPGTSVMPDSDLDLVVAGTKNAVLMVESEANLLSEEVMLGAVMFGHQHFQTAINAITELATEVNTPALSWVPPPVDNELIDAVEGLAKTGLETAYQIADKMARYQKINEIIDGVIAELSVNGDERDKQQKPCWDKNTIQGAVNDLKKRIVRGRILSNQKRIDGRDNKTVRPISVRVGLLPRTHGSALFTRGETQAMVVTTLGSSRDAQMIDALDGVTKDHFMLHYNFPPFCVGEVGRIGSTKRREIGHGRLARRGVGAIIPTQEEFPYVIRVVSEITESNGSSSMASVCGTSLALMDAGVPVKQAVAGIAMGLIKSGDEFAVLTDILGDEDHLGDMDFKVAGTVDGITALQMDIKIDGITEQIMQVALEQANAGRQFILSEMNKVIDRPREAISDFAPQMLSIKIDPDKIREVIGKGGSTIRSITEKTGASIDIDDNGNIKIMSPDKNAANVARHCIEQITAEIEAGHVYEGKVVRLMDFGAFVNILPGKDGLVHISQISQERVERVSDKLSEGDLVKVKVLEVDRQGRIRLSMKAVGDDSL